MGPCISLVKIRENTFEGSYKVKASIETEGVALICHSS